MGMGRGKVGEIVFSRQDGEQVFRARNRHPHNPQTNKQLVQRAIMATIMSAYSAGREIFDHSFQGYSVGAGCQRRFLSLNANALRTKLGTEWDTAAGEESLAKVTAPKIQTPIPNEYIISEGSMTQDIFNFSDGGAFPIWSLPAPQANEKVKDYAARVGLIAGDIYTFVFFETSKADADVLYKTYGIASVDYDIIYRGAFGWVRLITKNLAAVETVLTVDSPLSTLFDVENGGVGVTSAGSLTLDDTMSVGSLSANGATTEANGHAIGLIKSRRDEDLRSNATMVIGNPDEFGLYWNDVLTAWRAGTTQIGASDLILEGGDE